MPHLPFRWAPKMIRLASADQIGCEFSCVSSNVRRDVLPSAVSRVQISPAVPSWRWTAIRLPSGEIAGPKYKAGMPTDSMTLPLRSTKTSWYLGMRDKLPAEYAKVPFSDTEKAGAPLRDET